MAAVTKSGTPSLSTPLPPNNCRDLGKAGEALGAFDAVYKKSDGKYWRSQLTGSAGDAVRQVDGFASAACEADEPISVLHDVRARYGAGLTPGTNYYLSATVAGGLDTTANSSKPIARSVDDTRVELRRTWEN